MKKIVCIILTMLLILAMAVPAYAVTPTLDTPTITVSDISDSVQANIEEQYDFSYAVDAYLDEHPIAIDPTEAPTEEPENDSDGAKSFTVVFEWNRWLYQWCNNLIH